MNVLDAQMLFRNVNTGTSPWKVQTKFVRRLIVGKDVFVSFCGGLSSTTCNDASSTDSLAKIVQPREVMSPNMEKQHEYGRGKISVWLVVENHTN